MNFSFWILKNKKHLYVQNMVLNADTTQYLQTFLFLEAKH